MLYASRADARATTFAKVLAAGEAYCRDTRALLLRASLLQHDFLQVGWLVGGGWRAVGGWLEAWRQGGCGAAG